MTNVDIFEKYYKMIKTYNARKRQLILCRAHACAHTYKYTQASIYLFGNIEPRIYGCLLKSSRSDQDDLRNLFLFKSVIR